MHPIYHQKIDRVTVLFSLAYWCIIYCRLFDTNWKTIILKLENHYRSIISAQSKEGETIHIRKNMPLTLRS